MKQYNLRVFGKVQGVWFRANTMKKAQELGLTGFVRNDDDGTVYIEAAGEKELLEKLAYWCLQGPEEAKVERVEFEETKAKRFSGFTILGEDDED